MQVVSTLIGSTVAILFGWAVLPWYGSRRMLGDQASALRAVLDLMHRWVCCWLGMRIAGKCKPLRMCPSRESLQTVVSSHLLGTVWLQDAR